MDELFGSFCPPPEEEEDEERARAPGSMRAIAVVVEIRRRPLITEDCRAAGRPNERIMRRMDDGVFGRRPKFRDIAKLRANERKSVRTIRCRVFREVVYERELRNCG